jgi:glycosyltransferase involved in cell wall biosynthesis
MPAPIILFVYNRPEHTRRTITSLQGCDLARESHLYVFADGSKSPTDAANVRAVRQLLQSVEGFGGVTVTAREANQGLARSVISGVTEVLREHGRAVVLEDDLVFARNYLQFMNDALETYAGKKRIFSVSGYSYPLPVPPDFTDDVYLLPRASSWGWATWRDRWERADWEVTDYPQFLRSRPVQDGFAEGGRDLVYMLRKQQLGRIDSWAVRWSYAHYKHGAYCLFPVQSKVHNTGNDKSGTHSPRTTRFGTEVSDAPYRLPPDPRVDPRLVKHLQKFFEPSYLRKLINALVLR